MTRFFLFFLLFTGLLYAYEDQYKLIRELNKIEYSVSKLQEKVDTINSSIRSEEEAIVNLEVQLQFQSQSMLVKKKAVQEKFKDLVLYSTPERLNFLMDSSDFDSINKSEALLSVMLKKDLKEYRILDEESKKINDTKEFIAKEKEKLEEDKKNYAVYLEDLKQARDRKKELLDKVKSTSQGYRALAKRLEKGRQKISYFAGSGNKIKKIPMSRYESFFKNMLAPLKGKILSPFGKIWDSKIKNWTYNKGVLVGADYGQEVRSISEGSVSFSGWILGYGKVLIIKHKDSFFSIYAHLARSLFKTGDTVRKGSVIGSVGDSGSVEKSSLYFELRQDRNNIDPTPLFY